MAEKTRREAGSRRGGSGVDEWGGPLWPPVGAGRGKKVQESMSGYVGRPQGPNPASTPPPPLREIPILSLRLMRI